MDGNSNIRIDVGAVFADVIGSGGKGRMVMMMIMITAMLMVG